VDPGPAPGSDQALHVLAMAQRTADDHLQAVYQAAETMKAEAQAAAEQIRRDAEAAREEIRAQADQLLAVARETVEQELREARAQAEALQREARQALDEARERADRTDAAAKTAAEDLRRAAQFKYDHVVGGLESTRESYQRQIEALAQFDHEYRARLSSFMQGQLRALWTDQPHIDDKQLTGPRKTRASFGQAA
jgi:membrane protein involved in colicin uptake